jgi:hypothetical protein
VVEIGRFLRQLAGPGGIDWPALSAADVTGFVTGRC